MTKRSQIYFKIKLAGKVILKNYHKGYIEAKDGTKIYPICMGWMKGFFIDRQGNIIGSQEQFGYAIKPDDSKFVGFKIEIPKIVLPSGIVFGNQYQINNVFSN